MPIEIRILRDGDEHLLDRVADVFDDPLDRAATEEFLQDPRHHLAVALDGDSVVGFASGVHYRHPDKPHPELWINEVGVATSHEGQGIGKAVVSALLDCGRKHGCKLAWVLTERSNTRARGLYRSTGGVEISDENVLIEYNL